MEHTQTPTPKFDSVYTSLPATPLGALARQAWEIYTTNFKFFLLLNVVFLFPLFLVQEILGLFLGESSVTATIVAGVLSVIIIVFSFWFNAAVVLGVVTVTRGGAVDFATTVRAAYKHWWKVAAVGLLQGLLLIPLFLALVIPFFIFIVYWIFSIQAAVVEKKRYYDALRFSRSIVRGRWWEVFSRVLLIGLAVGAIVLAITSVTAALAEKIPLLDALVMLIIEVIAVYMTIFVTVYFLDLRKNFRLTLSQGPQSSSPAQ